MRLFTSFAAIFFAAIAPLCQKASAAVATYTPSAQNVTFTGLGVDDQGRGQSRLTWGACAFDGSVTKCLVTAPYTGVGSGGTINFLLTYSGNGLSPLNAVSRIPGANEVFFSLSSGTFEVTLVDKSGLSVPYYQFPNFNFFFDLTAVCTVVQTCSTSQVNATPGATISGRVNGALDAAGVIQDQGVITASSYGAYPALAPGTWMEIYGSNLANVRTQLWAGEDFNGVFAPTKLGGTSVTIGGKPAYINFVSPGQVNAQVPSGLATGPQPVVVTTYGGPSIARTITVNNVQPGLLAPAVFKLAAGQYVAALFPDGVTFVLPPLVGAPTARAKPGDTIVMYGVGFGPVTPDIPAGQIVTQANRLQLSFQATFAGIPATVAFAGLTGNFLGLYQFNIVVPNVPAGDAVPFAYTLNGVPGPQNLIVAIRN